MLRSDVVGLLKGCQLASSNSSPPRATARFSVRGCKLSRRTAERLLRAMRDGYPPGATVKVSTRRSIIRLQAENFDDLAAAVAESTEVGDPELLDNLEISVENYSVPGEPSRTVQVRVTEGATVICYLYGDPAWVRGKQAALQPLLEDTRPFKRDFWYGPVWTFGSWGVSFALVLAPLVAWLVTGSIAVNPFLTAALTVCSLFLGVAVGRTVSRARRVEIWIRQDELPRNFLEAQCQRNCHCGNCHSCSRGDDCIWRNHTRRRKERRKVYALPHTLERRSDVLVGVGPVIGVEIPAFPVRVRAAARGNPEPLALSCTGASSRQRVRGWS